MGWPSSWRSSWRLSPGDRPPRQPRTPSPASSRRHRRRPPASMGLRFLACDQAIPIQFHVPVAGDKPIRYSADNLPDGVKLNTDTGQLSGSVAKEGTYKITLHASNAKGNQDRAFRLIVGDTIALTPPMGWNSYNVWSDQITHRTLSLAAARAMVSTGLIDHGWSYINMDDGWQGKRGGELNALQPEPGRFPDIKGMVDQIHAMGLKVGIYSSPWVMTYAGRLGGSSENPDGIAQSWPPKVPKNKKQLPFAIGQHHFVTQDATQFAEWGIDYLKYDWGPVEYPETKEMYDALSWSQPRYCLEHLQQSRAKICLQILRTFQPSLTLGGRPRTSMTTGAVSARTSASIRTNGRLSPGPDTSMTPTCSWSASWVGARPNSTTPD